MFLDKSSKRRGNHYGIASVCSGVAGLEPQSFVASTLRLYAPGPAAPLNMRLVVEKPPENVPLTLST